MNETVDLLSELSSSHHGELQDTPGTTMNSRGHVRLCGSYILCVFCCFSEDIPKELKNVMLADITVIATLGVGGFGRVELVIMCCLL